MRTAIDAFGDVDILVNNAGILRDRLVVNMTEQEWDDVIRVHLRGHFCPTRHVAAYWRDEHKAGRPATAQRRQHVVDVGSARQSGTEQLRRGEVGHRHVHPDRRQGAGPLRRQGQLHRPGGAHPTDAGDARPRRHHGGARGGVRRVGPGQRVAASSPTSRRRHAGSTARRSSSAAARAAGALVGARRDGAQRRFLVGRRPRRRPGKALSRPHRVAAAPRRSAELGAGGLRTHGSLVDRLPVDQRCGGPAGASAANPTRRRSISR